MYHKENCPIEGQTLTIRIANYVWLNCLIFAFTSACSRAPLADPQIVRGRDGAEELWIESQRIDQSFAGFSELRPIKVRGEIQGLTYLKGQKPYYAMKNGSGDWEEPTLDLGPHLMPIKEIREPKSPPGAYEILVLYAALTEAERRLMKEEFGLRLRSFYAAGHYVVKVAPEHRATILSLAFVRGLYPIRNNLNQNLEAKEFRRSGTYRLQYGALEDAPQVLATLQGLALRVSEHSPQVKALSVEIPPGVDVGILANLGELTWVEAEKTIQTDSEQVRSALGLGSYQDAGEGDRPGFPYLGEGIRGHVFEGIMANHPDFGASSYRDKPKSFGDAAASVHGTAIFGILFGLGLGEAEATGLLPRAQGYYSSYESFMDPNDSTKSRAGRYEFTAELLKSTQIHFQTASWGHGRSTEYNLRSAEIDQIALDLDLAITQSQSNSCSRLSRPEAWAKNLISVGGIYGFASENRADDSWKGNPLNCASIGPADDGRVKPDLVGHYDHIRTTSSDGLYMTFGGTSGATPIVAGALGLSIEFLKDRIGIKGPIHAATIKALLINTARAYPFSGPDHDLGRNHQGWGYPHLGTLWEERDSLWILNEDHELATGESFEKTFEAYKDAKELRFSLVYRDPIAAMGAPKQLVNEIYLKATGPGGEVYFGNYGLGEANQSLVGGQPDLINNVQNIFVRHPKAGKWLVEIRAKAINQGLSGAEGPLKSPFAFVASGVNP